MSLPIYQVIGQARDVVSPPLSRFNWFKESLTIQCSLFSVPLYMGNYHLKLDGTNRLGGKYVIGGGKFQTKRSQILEKQKIALPSW